MIIHRLYKIVKWKYKGKADELGTTSMAKRKRTKEN